MADPTIKNLGPYHIDRVVGRGGMGSVYAAHHEETGDKAAIKVLAPALAADESFRDRFVAEIASLEKLNHPNIVKLYGYGETDGHLYYSMELVEGTNLEQEIARGRKFTWRDVTQIGIDISRALKHAHDHGVIHRDLKPANLLVDANDTVKLTDFGIAKLFGASRVTYNGSVLGTADYMAPEQAAGEATTPRCDLYSLGCVMYALLAGQPPFKGKSIAEVVHKARYEQHAPVSRYSADVPRDLEQIINELLEKDPEERIRTALSLTHRLRSMQQALSISTTGQDNFSSDSTSVSPSEQTERIVNPPPDIAERPTVLLPPGSDAPATQKSPAKPSKRKGKKKKLDHFTTVKLEKSRSETMRGSDYSSAIPLLLLLLTVLGGLIGGFWYNMLPMTADDLHARIMSAAEDQRLASVSKSVDRFLEKYPEDPRIEGVRELQEEIEIQRLQKRLEIRARGRKETGKLTPIEHHCNEAFRAYREHDIEHAINILQGVELMYSPMKESDVGIGRTLEVVARLNQKWREELSRQIEGLREDVESHHKLALSKLESDPDEARLIWQGITKLYGDRSWADDLTDMARQELAKLPPSGQTAITSTTSPPTNASESDE